MAVHYSSYEENMILHSENARLRRIIEIYQSDGGLQILRKEYEKKLKEKDRIIRQQEKQIERFSQLYEQMKDKYYESENNCDSMRIELEDVYKKIAELMLSLEEKDAEIEKYKEEIVVYEGKFADKIKDLNEQLSSLKANNNRNYENSSKPSSQSPNRKKITNNRERSGKKPGAQPGHEHHARKRLEPTEIIELTAPEDILNDENYYETGNVIRKQVVDFVITAKVTEYVAKEYRNRITGSRYHVSFPAGIKDEVTYGENILAFAYLLNAYLNVSVSKTHEFIKEITDDKVCLSAGTINGLGKKFSVRTAPEREELFKKLVVTPVLNSDATNTRVNGVQKNVYVCADPENVLYFYREKKGHEGVKGTPVETTKNTIIHDHDKTFYGYGGSHQECLAHVLRYLKDGMENEPDLTWNKDMHELLQATIHLVKGKEGGLSSVEIKQITDKYEAILKTAEKEYTEKPPSKYYRKGYNLYKQLKDYESSHLLFLTDPKIEYTNNRSERLLRCFKKKQAQVGTFRSTEGITNLCNGLSIIKTHKLRGDNIYSLTREVFSLPATDPV